MALPFTFGSAQTAQMSWLDADFNYLLDLVQSGTFSFPGVFTNTAMNLGVTADVGGLDPTAFYHRTHPGNFVTSALMGAVQVPSTSTVFDANAVTGYASTESTITPAIGGAFYALNLANGTTSYGINPLVDDQGFISTVVGAEFDVGCRTSSSTALGINMVGVFTAGTPSNSTAYQISALNSPWNYGLVCHDGNVNNFALVGALGTGANSDGQPIQFAVRDSTNTSRSALMQAQHTSNGCNIVIETPTGGTILAGSLLVVDESTFQKAIGIDASGGFLATFTSASVPVGSISVSGSTTVYNTTSDGRLKTDLIPLRDSASFIDRLKAVWFRWKGKPDEPRRPGFIAQDVHEVFPWAVTPGRGEPGEDSFQPWQMDATTLVPLLVAEIQDLRRRVASLEERLA